MISYNFTNLFMSCVYVSLSIFYRFPSTVCLVEQGGFRFPSNVCLVEQGGFRLLERARYYTVVIYYVVNQTIFKKTCFINIKEVFNIYDLQYIFIYCSRRFLMSFPIFLTQKEVRYEEVFNILFICHCILFICHQRYLQSIQILLVVKSERGPTSLGMISYNIEELVYNETLTLI